MSRLADTILGQKAYGQYAQAPMVDVKNGGQNGPMTDLTSFVSNSAYVRRNIVALLIEVPRGFRDLDPGTNTYAETLKALIELHPKSIEGLNSTITAEFVENAVGGAGEMQEDISNTTRARSTPTFVWTEKYGKPIRAFLQNWIQGLMMDPITKYPLVISNENGRKPTDLLPDYTGMTVLFFEPDPTHTKVLEAWLCTNMMPKTSGEITGRRDLTQGGESLDYSVEFTALTQHGFGVVRFAQRLLDGMNLNGMNPNLQRSFVDTIVADVTAAGKGYTESMADNARTKIRS